MRAAVELVGAGFDRTLIADSAGHALLGVEGIGDDVDGLHRIGRGHVRHDVRQPRIGYGRAVQPRIVVG